MSKNIAIKVENLSKQYRLGQVGTGTISHDINRWWHLIRGKEDPYLKIGESNDRTSKGNSEYVWALRDINFEVEKGEVLGIIGKNGAGKSTLLKLLSKVTSPTTGAIKTKGRIASLLEVGTGFHPEMTGRENIYMNGTIMGMSRQEISAKLDEIVEFAGVSRYIDTPVKRYSSGMTVRLGFSIAAHLEPEILIVDEVLAVGDAEFQKKAIGKMQDVSKGEGRTVLFVSHNMASVKSLCTRAILLQNGTVNYKGSVIDVIKYYQNNLTYDNLNIIKWKKEKRPGNNFLKINTIYVEAINGEIIDVDSGIYLAYEFENFKENIILSTTVEITTVEEVIVFHTGFQVTPNKDSKKGVYQVKLEIPPNLLNYGRYKIKLIFGENSRYLLFKMDDILIFEVENSSNNINSIILPGIIKPKLNFFTNFHES